MTSAKQLKLQIWETNKEELEEEIINYENMRHQCSKQLQLEGDWDKKEQLEKRKQYYSDKIKELFKNLEKIENDINILESSSSDLISNNQLDILKNQLKSNIDKSLFKIDFKKALETFEKIQSQFNKDGDAVLFIMEETLIKRGDLCLQRFRDDLQSNTNSAYGQPFRHFSVKYTSGNLDAVVQGIGNFLNIKPERMTSNQYMSLVVQKIGDSLQNNSVLFIEIDCDISCPSEIVPLIPWFVKKFWQPLRVKLNEVREDYEGIKVVAVITSNLTLNQRLSEDNLSCYCNNNFNCFVRDKFVKIPLENWTKEDIFNWLKVVNPSLKKDNRDRIASKIYNTTQGQPTAVCYCLQQEWRTLI